MAKFAWFSLLAALVSLTSSLVFAQPTPSYWCERYAEYGWDFSAIPDPCRCGGMSDIEVTEYSESRRILSFAISVVCGGVSRLEGIRDSWQSGFFGPGVSLVAKAKWNITGIQVNLTELLLSDAGPDADDARLQWNDLLNTPFKIDKDADVVVSTLEIRKLRKLPSASSKNPTSIWLNSTKFRELQELKFTSSAEDIPAFIPNDMFVVNKRPDLPITIRFEGHNLTGYTVAPNAFRQIGLNRRLTSMSINGALTEVPFAMLANTRFSSHASGSGSYDTLNFAANNITSLEVPREYQTGNKFNFPFSQLSFDSNKVVEIGDHPLWNHMQKNAPISTISLTGNKISRISEKAFDAILATAASSRGSNYDFDLISNALTEVPSFMKHLSPNIIAYIGWNNITSAKRSDFNDEWLKARKGEKWAGYLLGNPYNCTRQKLGWFACWLQDIMQSLDETPISIDCAGEQQQGKTITQWVTNTLARDGTCKGYFPDDDFFH